VALLHNVREREASQLRHLRQGTQAAEQQKRRKSQRSHVSLDTASGTELVMVVSLRFVADSGGELAGRLKLGDLGQGHYGHCCCNVGLVELRCLAVV
jgi:hypothetical protein